MHIKQADFVISNTDPALCPAPDKPEYAFIGRSNVGKSSLINRLVNRPGLAKTSGKPGKTQLINHFIINKSWYLVDLPGYGYAQVSKTDREKFAALINGYLTGRPNLQCIFVLVDGRIAPQTVDLDFMTRLAEQGLPFVVVMTKTERMSAVPTETALATYQKVLLETFAEAPQIFVTSATTGRGRDEVLAFIDEINATFKPVKTKFVPGPLGQRRA